MVRSTSQQRQHHQLPAVVAILLVCSTVWLHPVAEAAPAVAVGPVATNSAAGQQTGARPFLKGRSLIVGGEKDNDNMFSGVCAFLRIAPTTSSDSNGGSNSIGTAPGSTTSSNPRGVQLLPTCSGVLLTPSLVLTAAHCVAFFEGFVTCDNPLSARTNMLYSVRQVQLPRSLNLQAKLSERSTDLALAQLNASVPGVYITTLPGANDTGRLAAAGTLTEGAPMTVVGYGEISSPPGSDPINRNRKYVATRFSGINNVTLRFGYQEDTGTGAPCEGDSGGPAYQGPPDQARSNRQLLGIVIGGDELCKVGGYILRLDTPSAREFLQSNGAPVPG